MARQSYSETAIARVMRYAMVLFALMMTALFPASARAQVAVSFYSHDFGSTFPHSFFTVKGQLQRGGPEIDTNYGYTPKVVETAILFGGWVSGEIETSKASYVASSRRHFTVVVPDATYDALMALVQKWGSRPKGYNLSKQNCVHFVGEAAQIVGMKVNFNNGLIKRPRSFVDAMMQDNAAWFAARGAMASK
jgi:hypothetical protein